MLRFLELELVDVVTVVVGELIRWLVVTDTEDDDNGDVMENGDSDDDELVDEDGWASWAPRRWWAVVADDDPLASAATGTGPVWGPCLTMDRGNLSVSAAGASSPWEVDAEADAEKGSPFSTPMMAIVEAVVDR